jgi:hypothetical protein
MLVLYPYLGAMIRARKNPPGRILVGWWLILGSGDRFQDRLLLVVAQRVAVLDDPIGD